METGKKFMEQQDVTLFYQYIENEKNYDSAFEEAKGFKVLFTQGNIMGIIPEDIDFLKSLYTI